MSVLRTPRPLASSSIFALAALHLAGTDVRYELTFRKRGMARKVAKAIETGDDVALALIAGEDREALFAHNHDGQTKQEVATARVAAKAAKVQASASIDDCEAAMELIQANVHGFVAYRRAAK